MSPRVRRKKKSAAARLRPFWILLLLLAALAGFGGYYAATWPGFFPKHIIVSGNRIVPRDEIVERAQIEPRANLWLQNMGAAASRIDRIPYVLSAAVHRSLPADVRITVRERVPYAVLKSATGAVVVDRDLRVLQPAGHVLPLPELVAKSIATPADGQFVKDADVQRLRDDCETLAQAHVVVASLQFDKFGDLVASMRNGVRLLLGDDTQLNQKVSLVGPILSQVARQGRRIAAVDLRAPKTPVVVYK